MIRLGLQREWEWSDWDCRGSGSDQTGAAEGGRVVRLGLQREGEWSHRV